MNAYYVDNTGLSHGGSSVLTNVEDFQGVKIVFEGQVFEGQSIIPMGQN